MDLKLQAGQSIQITGPVKLHVIEGTLGLLGAKIKTGEEIIIKEGKHFPFDVEENSQIELIGSNILYNIADTSLIPLDRKELAEELIRLPLPAKIMVLGAIDTGKTTVICYLANYFFNLGKSVAVIDLDMGQQDIGPPSTITVGIVEQPVLKLSDIPLSRMAFIGKTSPVGRLVQTLSGARELLDYATQKAEVILIDTTGWVHGGAARAYKSAKIHNLKPDFLVALQSENEINHILEPFESAIPIKVLTVYLGIESRNPSTRKFLRESKFNRYFSNASSHLLDLNQIKIENSYFRSGAKLKETDLNYLEKTLECDFIYAEKAADALFLVKKPSGVYNKFKLKDVVNHFKISDIRIISKSDESGLLVGLSDSKFITLGIGIVENIIYHENQIRIYTPVDKDVKYLQLGLLKLSKTGQELEELKYSF